MKTRKIGIIGLGHVGAHVAYSLAVQGIADELVLVDSDEKKVESECQDLRDSVAYKIKDLEGQVELDAAFTFSCQAEMIIFELSLRSLA